MIGCTALYRRDLRERVPSSSRKYMLFLSSALSIWPRCNVSLRCFRDGSAIDDFFEASSSMSCTSYETDTTSESIKILETGSTCILGIHLSDRFFFIFSEGSLGRASATIFSFRADVESQSQILLVLIAISQVDLSTLLGQVSPLRTDGQCGW